MNARDYVGWLKVPEEGFAVTHLCLEPDEPLCGYPWTQAVQGRTSLWLVPADLSRRMVCRSCARKFRKWRTENECP